MPIVKILPNTFDVHHPCDFGIATIDKPKRSRQVHPSSRFIYEFFEFLFEAIRKTIQ